MGRGDLRLRYQLEIVGSCRLSSSGVITMNLCTRHVRYCDQSLGQVSHNMEVSSCRAGSCARRTCLLRHRPSETLGVASRRGGIRMSPFERRDVHALEAQPVSSGPACDQLPYERS